MGLAKFRAAGKPGGFHLLRSPNIGLGEFDFLTRTRDLAFVALGKSLVHELPAGVLPAAVAAVSTAAAAAVLFWPGFVDIEGPAIEVTSIDCGYGLCGEL